MPEAVTIIVPVLNESKHLAKVLDSLYGQDWPGFIEIIVIDNGSTDGTLDVLQHYLHSPTSNREVRVLHNPERNIPKSVNMGWAAATHEVVIRLDGHTYPPKDFVANSMDSLLRIGFDGIVGGWWDIIPAGPDPRAVAACAVVKHKFGVGKALYRSSKRETVLTDTDTIPFGASTKAVWSLVGGYDETLLSAEDYDFNLRVRGAGLRVVLDPRIALKYIARPDGRALFLQYYRYGTWTAILMLKHRRVPTPRKLAPVLALTMVLLSSLFWRKLFWTLVFAYAVAVAGVAVSEGLLRLRRVAVALYIIPTIIIVHLAYSLGTLNGLARWACSSLLRRRANSRTKGSRKW